MYNLARKFLPTRRLYYTAIDNIMYAVDWKLLIRNLIRIATNF